MDQLPVSGHANMQPHKAGGVPVHIIYTDTNIIKINNCRVSVHIPPNPFMASSTLKVDKWNAQDVRVALDDLLVKVIIFISTSITLSFWIAKRLSLRMSAPST